MPTRRNNLFSAVTVAAILLAWGCRPSTPFAPVSGQVQLDGKPLESAYIVFQPTEGKPEDISIGNTDTDGRYTLKTLDGRPGAMVGKHQISITTIGPDAMDDERSALPKDRVPKRYRETPLTLEVSADGNAAADFDLEK